MIEPQRKKTHDRQPRTYAVVICAPNIRLSVFQGGLFTLMAIEPDLERLNRKFHAAQKFLKDEGQIVIFSWPKEDIGQLTVDARFNLDRVPNYKDVRTTTAAMRDLFWKKVFRTVEPGPRNSKKVGSGQSGAMPLRIRGILGAVFIAIPIGMSAYLAWANFVPTAAPAIASIS